MVRWFAGQASERKPLRPKGPYGAWCGPQVGGPQAQGAWLWP